MSMRTQRSVECLTSEDFRVEYQNQMKLTEEGLEFTLKLYRNEAITSTWVSISL